MAAFISLLINISDPLASVLSGGAVAPLPAAPRLKQRFIGRDYNITTIVIIIVVML